MRPKTFLQCFALEQREYKAKHCRNVLERVLGRKNKIQNRSLSMQWFWPNCEIYFVLEILSLLRYPMYRYERSKVL